MDRYGALQFGITSYYDTEFKLKSFSISKQKIVYISKIKIRQLNIFNCTFPRAFKISVIASA